MDWSTLALVDAGAELVYCTCDNRRPRRKYRRIEHRLGHKGAPTYTAPTPSKGDRPVIKLERVTRKITGRGVSCLFFPFRGYEGAVPSRSYLVVGLEPMAFARLGERVRPLLAQWQSRAHAFAEAGKCHGLKADYQVNDRLARLPHSGNGE